MSLDGKEKEGQTNAEILAEIEGIVAHCRKADRRKMDEAQGIRDVLVSVRVEAHAALQMFEPSTPGFADELIAQIETQSGEDFPLALQRFIQAIVSSVVDEIAVTKDTFEPLLEGTEVTWRQFSMKMRPFREEVEFYTPYTFKTVRRGTSGNEGGALPSKYVLRLRGAKEIGGYTNAQVLAEIADIVTRCQRAHIGEMDDTLELKEMLVSVRSEASLLLRMHTPSKLDLADALVTRLAAYSEGGMLNPGFEALLRVLVSGSVGSIAIRRDLISEALEGTGVTFAQLTNKMSQFRKMLEAHTDYTVKVTRSGRLGKTGGASPATYELVEKSKR